MATMANSRTVAHGTSFEAFYRRELRGVVALAYVLSGSRTAAEELAQDAFVAAYRRWDEVGGYDDPVAWVRRVCVNRSTSWIRRQVSEARAMARLAARPVRPEEMAPDAEGFWRAVRRLPRRQMQVLALRYVEDLPIEAIARVLDCAEGTVKAHLHRGRTGLASALGCEVDDEGGAG